MTAKERYNAIIDEIEDLVINKRMHAKDIAERIAGSQGMTYRDLAVVLGFLTGEQLINYIRSRKYQAAYAYMIRAKVYDVNGALAIADLSDQPRLINVFNKHFGITPKKAFEMKDATRLSPPKSWEEISQEYAIQKETSDNNQKAETIFGLDVEAYERITLINDLMAAYGLDVEYAQVAVRLSDECNVPLEKAFGYIEEFKADRDIAVDDEDISEEYLSEMMSDEWLWATATDPAMLFCCMQCRISVSSALWIVDELRRLGYSPVEKLSPYFIIAFKEEYGIHSAYLKRACEYYEQHIDDSFTDEDFEDFLSQIDAERPIEIAFEDVLYKKAVYEEDDYQRYTPDDADDAFLGTGADIETWAAQETSNWGPRFDDEYDPDNL